MVKIELRANTHYWALLDGKLVVVLYDGEDFTACGAWEGSIPADQLYLIEKIRRPEKSRGVKLYFGSY